MDVTGTQALPLYLDVHIFKQMSLYLSVKWLSRLASTCTRYRCFLQSNPRLVFWRKLSSEVAAGDCLSTALSQEHDDLELVHFFSQQVFNSGKSLGLCSGILKRVNKKEHAFLIDKCCEVFSSQFPERLSDYGLYMAACATAHLDFIRANFKFQVEGSVYEGLRIALALDRFEVFDLYLEIDPDMYIPYHMVLVYAIDHQKSYYIDFALEIISNDPNRLCLFDCALASATETHDLVTIAKILKLVSIYAIDLNNLVICALQANHFDLVERWMSAGATDFTDFLEHATRMPQVEMLHFIANKVGDHRVDWKHLSEYAAKCVEQKMTIADSVIEFIKQRRGHYAPPLTP